MDISVAALRPEDLPGIGAATLDVPVHTLVNSIAVASRASRRRSRANPHPADFRPLCPGASGRPTDRCWTARTAAAPGEHRLCRHRGLHAVVVNRCAPAGDPAAQQRLQRGDGSRRRAGLLVVNHIGYGLIVAFNSPVPIDVHSVRCDRRLASARDFDGHRLRIRIGFATGPVAAGTVGGADRQTFSST
jgi:hypothetical protein